MTKTTEHPHILLIEDEDTICEIVTYMLESVEASVTVCKSGKQGVSTYRDRWQSIDLVILDLLMPEMDGEETFYQLRDINPNLVVLISSGFGLDEKSERLLKEGARGFIQKPFRLGPLVEKIREILPDFPHAPQ